jgi:hypothetical protein
MVDALWRDCTATLAPGEQVVACVVAMLIVSGHGASRRFRWALQVAQQPGLVATRSMLFADAGRSLEQAAAGEREGMT